MLKKILFGILIFVLIAAVSFFTDARCLTRAVSGYPCPGCGITRATLSFLHGDWESAFNFHPLFLLIDAYIVFIAVYMVFRKEENKFITISSIIIGALMLGVYIFRMITMFPHTEPMTYNQNSLYNQLNQIIEFIVNIL